MSYKIRKRYRIWVEPAKTPAIEPEIYRLLAPLIQDLALIEDVTGPWCVEVVPDEYIAHLAKRLGDSVARVFCQAGRSVTNESLAEICRVAGSETYVIRGLNEARLNGEISLKDLQQLPFFTTYQEYFRQTHHVVAKAFEIALATAASDGSKSDSAN